MDSNGTLRPSLSPPNSRPPTTTPAISAAQANATAGIGTRPKLQRRLRLGAGSVRGGLLALASSAASRSTSAMIRAFNAGGGSSGGADSGSACAATRRSAASARQAGHSLRWDS